MTDTPEQQNPQVAAAAEKMQEMGKKFTGFLKNLDVKDLAEKAKMKVDEVKAQATDLTAGKTAAFVMSREDITPEQMKEIVQKAMPAISAPFEKAAEIVLADVAAGVPVIARVTGATSCALTADSLIFISKYGEQYGADVVCLKQVVQTTVVPPRADTAGRFVVKTAAGDVKIVIADLEAYVRVLMFVKKMKEAAAK